MQNFTIGKVRILIAFLLLSSSLQAQLNIFQIMERSDLRIDQIEELAKRYFDSTGTARGTGFKQYQRWRYDAKFHLNETGYKLPPNYDWDTYEQWKASKGFVETGNEAAPANNSGPWIEKGPFSWNKSGGWNPGVGRITAIAVNPVDTTIMYVTSPGGGVWKTVNSGRDWTPLTDANGNWMVMHSVTIDPSNPNTIYAGSNSGIVIKSTDAGATWRSINRNISGIVGKILIHPTNPSIILVAAMSGLHRSVDGGTTWTRPYIGMMEDMEFKPNDPNTVYASGAFGSGPNVMRSNDGGITWTMLAANDGITGFGRTLLAVSPSDPNRVYAVQASGNEFGKLYVSDNSGVSFTTAISGGSANCTNFFGYETTGCGVGGQAGYDMAICVNPANADEVYIGGIIVFKSTDAGKSFIAQTAWSYPNSIGYNHADVHALEFVKKSVYSGSDGGIYISTDYGDNWKDLSAGLGIRQFYRVANSKTNAQLFTGGAQDNGSSVFVNNTWFDWLGADGMEGIISPVNENLMWGTSQFGTLYRTTNSGMSYTTLNRPSAGEWITPLYYEESEKAIYGAWTGIFKSLDSGATWINVSGSAINTSLNTMAIAPTDKKYIYASKGSTMFYTSNGGASWATNTFSASVNAIAVSPTNPAKVWVVTNNLINKLYLSEDAGATFTNVTSNLPAIIARSIAIDDDADETVYVGMNVGVYYINKNTTNFTNYTSNLPTVAINDLKIQQSGNLLRIASYGRGVWERPLVSGVAISCGTPTNLSATNVTTTSAELSWGAVTGSSSYTVEYKTADSSSWLVAATGIATNSYNIAALQPATAYDWRVVSSCSGVAGSYAISTLQTSITCQAASSLNATNITDKGATISWNAVSGGLNYQVEYKANTATTWNVLATATNATSMTLSGLNPSTLYDWRVRTNCSATNSSYSNMQFTSASPVTCVDTYESNNSLKQAITLNLGTGINATISNSNDEDWFKISTDNTTLTNIKVSANQLPADYDIFLYDRNQRMVGSSNNANTADEVLIFNTKATRTTYYIKVQGKAGTFNANSCYTLTAENSSSPWAPQVGAAYYSDEEVDGIIAYPNPANNFVAIKFSSAKEGKATVTITSAAGVVMKSNTASISNGFNQLTLPVSDIKPGLYLVKLQMPSFSFVKQIVVVR